MTDKLKTKLDIENMDEFFEMCLTFWDMGFDAAIKFMQESAKIRGEKRRLLRKYLIEQWEVKEKQK